MRLSPLTSLAVGEKPPRDQNLSGVYQQHEYLLLLMEIFISSFDMLLFIHLGLNSIQD